MRASLLFLCCCMSVARGGEPQPPAEIKNEPVSPGPKDTRLAGALTILSREGVHLLQLKKEQTYALQLESRGFFAALRIEDENNKTVHNGQESFVTFQPADDGVFRVSVSSHSGSCGQYALSVQVLATPKKNAEGVLEVGAETVVLTGTLAKPQAADKGKKKPSQAYDVRLLAGKTYVIDLMSKQFDTYLRVDTVEGKTLAQDDDSGDGNNSRLRFQPKTDGVFRVVATVFGHSGSGPFVLKLRME